MLYPSQKVRSQYLGILIKWGNKDTFDKGDIMTIWLILIGIVLFGIVAFVIYKYDDSEFSKATDFTFWDVWTKKKVHAAYKLMTLLGHVKGEHKVLLNLHVPYQKNKEIIDALLIHESGIFIMTIEHKNGWISGREQDIEWTQLLHNDKKQVFQNPVHKGQRGMCAIREQLPNISADVYETLVVFSNNCSFQKVELHSKKTDVMKTKDLNKWLSKLNGSILSSTEIQQIYDELKGLSNLNKSESNSATAQPSTN